MNKKDIPILIGSAVAGLAIVFGAPLLGPIVRDLIGPDPAQAAEANRWMREVGERRQRELDDLRSRKSSS